MFGILKHNNMKKWINDGLIIACLFVSAQGFSQTETFDILTYTPPKDWKKDAKPGVVNYSNVNTTTGVFCVIAIYASTVSTGDAENDFKRDWKELVSTPFKAGANPTTETTTTPDGWKVVTGSAPVKQDGIDLYIMLTVASGFGKSLSIRTSLNDQSYIAQIDALFKTMELDKTTVPVNSNNTAAVQSSGGTGKFGLMIYTTPAGWREQIFQDAVVFKPADLPAGDLLSVQIMQPLNFSGSLEEALAQSFAEATTMYNGTSMYQSGGKYSKNAPQKSFNGWEYIRGKGGIQVPGGDERGLEVFAVKINNRIERVAILESRRYCGGVSRYYASDRISYRNGIEDLLYSLQFSDFNAPVLKSGSAKGSGIIGLWQGTIQSTGAATGVRLEVFSPIFFNNGQVYFGPKVPTEGLDGLNSRIPPELYPRNWGTYTFSNGSGVLQMPFANIPFRTQGDKLIVNKNQTDWTFIKLNSVDGARFNGTYTMPKSYEMFPVITFTADGQFTDKGIIRVLGHDNNNCINPGFAAGSGTYEVKNYTVVFNYTDGRKVRIAFLGADYDKTNLSPSTLRMSFNEDPMNKQ
jgi:hypothetical protein